MGLDSWTDSEEEDSFPWSKRARTGQEDKEVGEKKKEEGGDLKKEEELKGVEGEKKMEGDHIQKMSEEKKMEVGGDAKKEEVMEEKKEASEAAEK